MKHTDECKFLGRTQDNVKRDVHIFADNLYIYAVYDNNTPDEWVTTAEIELVKENPEDYLFTPYIEFLHLIY